jgi:hypothetical protein
VEIPKDGQGKEEVCSTHPDLQTEHHYTFTCGVSNVFDKNSRILQDRRHQTEIVLLFHQQCGKYATLLHVINYVLGLVVNILNVCEFKVTNTTMG